MSDSGLWSRLRNARLVQVLLVYLGVSWILLEGIAWVRELWDLPLWIDRVSLILLLVGLFVVLATAWVLSRPLPRHPETGERERSSWELDLAEVVASLSRGEVPRLNWARVAAGGMFAFSLLFGFAGLYVLLRDQGRGMRSGEALAGDEAAPALAVLPFTVRNAEPDLREGMVELLSANLDGAAGLRVIDERTVLARWLETVGAGADADLTVQIGVARATGARWALLGNIVSTGSQMRISADLREVGSGQTLDRVQVEGAPSDIFRLVDDLSIAVLRHLVADEATSFSFDLAETTTHSLDALKAYWEGQESLRAGRFEAAIPHFRRAIAQDSTFGLARYRLAQAYGWLPEIPPEAQRESLEDAMRFINRVPRREALLLRATYAQVRESPEMVDSLRAAVQRYPDDPEAWYLLGDAIYHLLGTAPQNQPEMEEAFDRAVELDPSFAPYLIHWVELGLWWRPEIDDPEGRLERFRVMASSQPYWDLAYRLSFGDPAGKAALLARLDTVDLETRQAAALILLDARFAREREALLLSIAEQVRRPGVFYDGQLFRTAAQGRGQVSRALEYLAAPATDPAVRDGYDCELLEAYANGLSVPPSHLETAAARASSTAGACAWLVDGVLAADRDDWGAHARAIGRFQSVLRQIDDDRTLDSARIAEARRFNRRQVSTLEAYGRWRRGDPDGAVSILREIEQPRRLQIWWLARLHMELGRPQLAAVYLRRLWQDEKPLAYYHLGRQYEALADPVRAGAAYRYFIAAWSEADPELRPLVEEARRALANLPAAGS